MRTLLRRELLCGLGALTAGLSTRCAATPRAILDHPSRMTDDPRVGVFVSTPETFSTASYWIEGPEGLVVIDAQLLPSMALRALELAERVTARRAVLCVVLHPDPDRYGGVGVYRDRSIRVVSSRQVVAAIPAVDRERRAALTERFGERYLSRVVLPEVFGDRSQVLAAAGLRLNATVFGQGSSAGHVVIEWEGHVFMGDLVTPGFHARLDDADIDAWVQRLSEARELRPRWIHPGRGATGNSDLIDDQIGYLRYVQRQVREARPHGTPEREELAGLCRRIEARFANYGRPEVLPSGVSAEYSRQAARNR